MKRMMAIIAGALTLTSSALAQNPRTVEDDAWISLGGTIVEVDRDSIRLDYGDGLITVEVDDFDLDSETSALMVNDKVVVFGVMDDDLLESRTIEASSVFVESLGTFFYASSIDEEDFAGWPVGLDIGHFELSGRVSEVDGRRFVVSNGVFSVTVNTDAMPYNPMDERGYQRIEVGDRVRVAGEVERTLFDSAELEADWLIELRGGRR